MLCFVVRAWKKIKRVLSRAKQVLADVVEARVRRAWTAHHAAVARNATYAAVITTVIAGALGLVPVTDVLSAVLGAALGVYSTQRGSSRTNNWREDDWM